MAGKERTIEIFAVFDAIGTDTARMAEPGDDGVLDATSVLRASRICPGPIFR
jgi:hypothetical protein